MRRAASADSAPAEEPLLPSLPSPARRALAGLATLAGVGGFLAIAAGGLLLLTGDVEPPAAEPSASASPAPAVPAPAEPMSGAEAAAAPLPASTLADPRWIERVSDASGIPERALAAYAGAAIAVSDDYPWCGLGWNTLAAIGLVESDHGTAGGASLGDDGVSAPAIVGIALDGVGTVRVLDTDGGALDGDPVWDRAVGPLQFIPGTWAAYGRDGDGDGVADPNQIDDAALSAAHYLCDAGGDLTVAANWIAAVADYNPSVDYNHRVAEAADVYAAYG
ncbi:lytic transglycosylase domain-containing protein [Microbacterium tumbae]